MWFNKATPDVPFSSKRADRSDSSLGCFAFNTWGQRRKKTLFLSSKRKPSQVTGQTIATWHTGLCCHETHCPSFQDLPRTTGTTGAVPVSSSTSILASVSLCGPVLTSAQNFIRSSTRALACWSSFVQVTSKLWRSFGTHGTSGTNIPTCTDVGQYQHQDLIFSPQPIRFDIPHHHRHLLDFHSDDVILASKNDSDKFNTTLDRLHVVLKLLPQPQVLSIELSPLRNQCVSEGLQPLDAVSGSQRYFWITFATPRPHECFVILHNLNLTHFLMSSSLQQWHLDYMPTTPTASLMSIVEPSLWCRDKSQRPRPGLNGKIRHHL